MADTIKITETLAKLDKELVTGEPYVLGLPGNKRITFEDFMAWSGEKASAADELLDISTGASDADLDDFAEKWLSKKDFETWKAQGLSYRQKAVILRNATAHVLKDLTPGESDASSNS